MCKDKDKERERCRVKAERVYEDRKSSSLCVYCGRAPANCTSTKCVNCVVNSRANGVKHRNKIKDEVFARYGGYLCACCGETRAEMLQLDHVHGKGSQHRKITGSAGANTYRWLKKNGYPPGYQILCANCNWSKHINGGSCSHTNASVVITEVDYAYE